MNISHSTFIIVSVITNGYLVYTFYISSHASFSLYELDDTPRVAAGYLVTNSQFEMPT
jgi:hypothetical protein